MSRRRKRTKTLGDVIRLIVMLAALAVFLYSGYTLYGFYKEYKKSSDEYDNLENSYAADQEQESENIDNLEDDDALQSISGQEVRTVFCGNTFKSKCNLVGAGWRFCRLYRSVFLFASTRIICGRCSLLYRR